MTQINTVFLKKTSMCILLSFITLVYMKAEVSNDTISIVFNSKYPLTTEGVTFSTKQLIVPATLITIGTIGVLESNLDKKIRDKVIDYKGDIFIDNLLPFVNPASVYILNWSGIEGKHNFIDRSVIFGTSSALTIGSVYLLKFTTSRERPDFSNKESFPSMHTAIAFMGAEFLHQEFKDKSIWYGIAGYGIAACTGFLRIYNNKHWTSDVLFGAGIGILSTKAAYWLYPEIRKLYAGTILDNASFFPYISKQNFGLSISARF